MNDPIPKRGFPERLLRYAARRDVRFPAFIAVSLFAFGETLSLLVSFSFRYEHYSHIILVPLVTMGLIYENRKNVFSRVDYSLRAGGLLIFSGILIYCSGKMFPFFKSENDSLFLAVFSVVLVWIGGFVLFYGTGAFRKAPFPLFFLFLVVPIPLFILDRLVVFLQRGSAESAAFFFYLGGVLVYRSDLFFSFPGLDIEVAKECSGIRSAIALFITSLLASHFFLRSASTWRKILFSLSVVPIVMVKNGLRIVTITLLSLYVDRSFLYGNLHNYGGIPFFLLSLLMLGVILWFFRKVGGHLDVCSASEKKTAPNPEM